MIVLLHVLIAVSSLVWAGLVYLSPTRPKLRVSYTLIAATLASGTVLVVASGAHMLQACLSGCVYLAVVGMSTVAARHKLSVQQ